MQVRGNVSILVMFIMIATSLMGLLAMHFVQQMLEYSGVVHDYYKSYYLTKAGIEIGLTESNIRGIGFSTQIGSGFFAENMICGDRCEINTQVLGKTTTARNIFWNTGVDCSTENAFHLAKGENLILPLFSEKEFTTQKENLETLDSAKEQITKEKKSGSSSYDGLTKKDIEKIKITKLNSNSNLQVNMGVLALKKLDDGKIGEYNSDISFFQKQNLGADSIKKFFEGFDNLYKDKFNNHFFYLMIGNTNDGVIDLCIQAKKTSFGIQKKLPAQRFWIESIAKFDDTKMSMEALYKQAIPSFFANAGNF